MELWSRELILKRLCWRVENGNSISITRDAWIPGLPGFRSPTCAISSEVPKVASLISSAGE